ncbi:phage tail tube protein [Massilia sp. TS11]|uniref:phage tail tube protein n=1 Tax=Massilia sp. TS11 TaxID=2908003 RepID=UPI001EDB2CE7|nr:phage tail tube protein [Massilia sp. TS11]MCG2586490.1 hypothetical protein [Massilia sp. TS11]
MAAHTTPAQNTDTTYAISASLPATYDAAGYGATAMVYTEITQVESWGPYGAKRSINKFQPIKGAVSKAKGAPDYGDIEVVFAHIPGDAGQIIVKAADASPNHYSVKITYPDGEVDYLDVLVAGFEKSAAKEGEFQKITTTLGVCRAVVNVAAP